MRKTFAVLLFAMLSAAAFALPVSGTNLAINMGKYDPAPAEAGRFVTVWIDVTNRGSDIANDIVFTILPAYPFSLPDNDPNRTVSIPSDSSIRLEYRLLVDSSTPDTRGELKIMTKISEIGSIESNFNITIDNTLEDADLNALYVSARPAPYPGGLFNMSVDTVNSNKGTAYYVMARAESPAAMIERNEIFIGTLEPNDYDNIDFELRVSPDAVPGTYPLNIEFTYRDKDSKLFSETETVNFTVYPKTAANATQTDVPIWTYVIGIVVLLIAVRLLIPFGKWFMKPFGKKK